MVSRNEVGGTRTSETMSDEALIQTFIEEFFQGQTILLANRHLRTEPLFKSVQLLSATEGVIATAKLKTMPIEMVVRHGSAFGELLHRALMEQSFYPVMKSTIEGCYTYRYCEPPAGYHIQCATAKDLWRACWGRGFSLRSGIPMDLIIWREGPPGSKESWYSLRGMDCDLGQLTIKMLGWSDTVQSADLIVWARQIATTKSSGFTHISGKKSQDSSRSELHNHPPFRQ